MISLYRRNGKVAVVTGASSGIGAACAIDLVNAGLIVAALGRREHRLNELKDKLPEELRKNIHTMKCDVRIEAEVIETFKIIDENLGKIHILVNSAGIVNAIELTGKYSTNAIQDNIDTNILGAVYCVREAFNQMKDNKVDGHIILLNSIVGHYVPRFPLGSGNIYTATKFATTAMVETYRQEFLNAGTNVKITSISPGATATEHKPAQLRNIIEFPMLKPEDVSSAILYCISTPPNVQIHELIIKPLHEKF